MVEVVSYVERVAVEDHSLGIVERGTRQGTVLSARSARADHRRLPPRGIGDDQPVISTVCDDESLSGRVDDHLAGKPQRGPLLLVEFEIPAERCLVERALLLVEPDLLGHLLVDHLERCFAAADSTDVSLGVDQDHCRPEVDVVPTPDRLVAVVDDWVSDVVSQDSTPDVLDIFLGIEFWGMDSEDHQLVWVFLLELFQHRQDVHAVDAAVGPEVQQHDLAAEVTDVDRTGGVEIPGGTGQRTRRKPAAVLLGAGH